MKYLALVLLLAGCTDASWDRGFGSFGLSGHIICYSAGQKILEDDSTGRLEESDGGGWTFRNSKNNIVKIFADCIVIYKKWK